MEEGKNLGDILSAALNIPKGVNMEKIANFYRACKDLGWTAIEILGALNAEQFATLEKHILSAVKPVDTLQRVKLHSPFASDSLWIANKISCIKMVRGCGQSNLFTLKESKDFCEGYGVLNVYPDEFQRLIGIFGRAAIDVF